MHRKYKVGDIVKIKEDLTEDFECYSGVAESMLPFLGKEAVIVGRWEEDLHISNQYDIFLLDIDNEYHYWNPEMFDKVVRFRQTELPLGM